MAQLTCELCGSTDLVKDGDYFVCQKCGAKYSLEDARKMVEDPKPSMSQGPKIGAGGLHAQAKPTQAGAHAGVGAVASVDVTEPLVAGTPGPELHADSAANFDPVGINVGIADARAVNNYVCQGWQLLVDEYRALKNPPKARIEELATRAKECLLLLDNAAMLDPDDHAQNMLIYENCLEIIECVKDEDYYEKDDEGKFRRRSYPSPFDKFEVAGQKESWEDKLEYHRSFLERAWDEANPNLLDTQAILRGQAEEVQAQLDVLNEERKSKGFFNFSEKREVKDRMAPYEEQLRELNSQIRDIDRERENYIESILRELGSGYTRLDF